MGELRKRTVGPGAKDARTALLLDLTAVDLRTLRASDDPELLTAVDRVLEETSGPKEIWYVGSEGGRMYVSSRTRWWRRCRGRPGMTLAAAFSEVFTELATTRPLPSATEALRGAVHARRMLLLKSLLVRVERRRELLTSAARRDFEQDWALLERAEATDPAAARAVVDYPMTGTWLAEALAAPDAPAFERHLAHLRGVAVAAAVRAGYEVSATVTVRAGTLALPGLGVLRCPSGRARLDGSGGLMRMTDASDGEGLMLPHSTARPGSGGYRPTATGTGWTGLRSLPGSTVVLDDLDPYRCRSPGSAPRRSPQPSTRPSPIGSGRGAGGRRTNCSR